MLVLLLFWSHVHAQPLFYGLIDQGQNTASYNPTGLCPTFQTTGAGSWVPVCGTPQLLGFTGWTCSQPCVQGSEYCDANPLDAILMNGLPPTAQSEGVFKSFYFQSGLTYNICVFYSISPLTPGGGGTGYITFGAANGLSQYNFVDCQSAPPTLPPDQVIGTASSSATYASFTFTPTANYTQFVMYATADNVQQQTAIVTGIDITVQPVCATPTISAVTSPSPGQIQVTWSAITGVDLYSFDFTSSAGTQSLSYTMPQTLPTGAFPSTITNTFQTFSAGTYTVKVQAPDAACSGGSTPWSGSAGPVAVSAACLGTTYVSSVEPLSGGQCNVAWYPISGATSYNVEFLSGYTVVKTFNSTTTNPGSGVTFSGIPGGTYTVAVQGVASCGTGIYSSYADPVPISCLGSPYVNAVEPDGGGKAYVGWYGVSGANNYNVEFVNSAGVAVATFTTTATSGTFTGIPTGTYTVSVQANCSSCGPGPWASYSSSVPIY